MQNSREIRACTDRPNQLLVRHRLLALLLGHPSLRTELSERYVLLVPVRTLCTVVLLWLVLSLRLLLPLLLVLRLQQPQ
jgi:hypothetical protein